ncbi:respiratory burst oxidase homolog protein A-like [Aristolochia californica]|uniref:respiratory burst oxidase homolog protein A-like n=1 Tax=Aristolochia californica TaxID=171875 RepID=UPI0035DFC708
MEVLTHTTDFRLIPSSGSSSSRLDSGSFSSSSSSCEDLRNSILSFSSMKNSLTGATQNLHPEKSPCREEIWGEPPPEEADGVKLRREETSCRVAGRVIEHLRFIDRAVKSGQQGWKEVEERFHRLASTGLDGISALDPTKFGGCVGMHGTPEFAEELLGALRGGKDSQSHISKLELHELWCRITDHSFSSRTRIFFDLCGKEKDDRMTEMEIKQIISFSAFSSKLSVSQEEVEDYAALIMQELDSHQNGFIKISQLKNVLNNGSPTGEFCGKDQIPARRRDSPAGSQMSPVEVWFRTHWRRGWVVVCWLTACVLLFTWKFLQYRRRTAFEVMGYCLCTAKGAAETLKFNMALVLLPVCRNTVTWARKHRWINSIVPFNDNINFHKLIAGGIVVGVILHGGTHLACDFPRIAGADRSLFRRTIAVDFEHRQPSYVEILATTEVATGISMVILMTVAFSLATTLPRRHPSSLPSPFRRLAGFNTFWYSHHLFILVYILLVVHSMFLFLTKNVGEKTTWMYIAVPVVLYTGERIARAVRAGFFDVKVLKAITYPGKVLSLKLRKPEGFQYKSGMYVFVQCPQISPFEWHPFSLTSAPDDDHLGIHIRTLGDWSYQMYSHFQEASLSDGGNFPKVHIDGPYGAAAQDHVKYDVLMLIGLGIGATPFISVLKDIVHGLQKTNSDMIDGEESSAPKGPSRTYFYWVTREQSSFDWFRDVMKEVSEINQRKAVIELHNYLTSGNKEGDGRLALITAIQALCHTKNGFDIFSKTPVFTHFARPNWSRVFSKLGSRHEGETIGVFYCGSPALAKELERLCLKISAKTPTRFVFHKENY